jgi:hypothetical protein
VRIEAALLKKGGEGRTGEKRRGRRGENRREQERRGRLFPEGAGRGSHSIFQPCLEQCLTC